jgi:hypothetical protein
VRERKNFFKKKWEKEKNKQRTKMEEREGQTKNQNGRGRRKKVCKGEFFYKKKKKGMEEGEGVRGRVKKMGEVEEE